MANRGLNYAQTSAYISEKMFIFANFLSY
jgi:hypothetical protein